jgi:hypothetical protein
MWREMPVSNSQEMTGSVYAVGRRKKHVDGRQHSSASQTSSPQPAAAAANCVPAAVFAHSALLHNELHLKRS